MTSSKSPQYQPWRRLLCVLLVLVMLVTPLISTVAELHETEHAAAGDSHFDAHAGFDDLVNPAPNSDSDESSLHHLAHASHCCGHIVALLSTTLHLVLAPIQSALNIKIEHSRIAFLRISHFRPPIFS